MLISLVIPVYNEKENIKPLLDKVRGGMSGYPYELILVDDGSRDGTFDEILALNAPEVVLVRFARNYGQTSAIAAGIEAASGDYIATLDGDLQNDPADIPRMLEKLVAENLDVVAGRRRNRMDGLLLRKIPSRIANWIIRKTTKVKIHDYGCTLKIFKNEIAKQLDLYGELHRFIPLLSSIYGARIGEMDVSHNPRIHGVSKYGISRTFRVLSDLLLMLFLLRFRQKPMHLFGVIGLLLGSMGGMILLNMLWIKMMGKDIGDRPLLYLGILLTITGVQFITSGFLAELNMRTYFESQSKKPYTIAGIYRNGERLDA